MLDRAFLLFRARWLLPAIMAAVLAGCAAPAVQPGNSAPPESAAGLPTDPNALVLGAEVALQRNQYREAARAYVRAAQLANDEQLAEQATRVAYEHHQWTLVLAAAERWLELNQTNEEARRFAAFAALHLYQIDRAAEHLGFLLDTAFINPQAGFLALLPQLSEEGSAAGDDRGAAEAGAEVSRPDRGTLRARPRRTAVRQLRARADACTEGVVSSGRSGRRPACCSVRCN